MKIAPSIALLALAACASACASSAPSTAAAPAWPVITANKSVDGQFPPPTAPADLKWENLLSGKLTDQWTGMSMSIDDPTLTTRPNPDQPGSYILHIGRKDSTGLIRSLKPYGNCILEYEWRHLTEAPNAGGGKDPKTGEMTSGNSGILIFHSAFPKPGSPYPGEGHEIQVCNLGNGSWYTSHGDTFTLPGTTSQAIPDPRFAVSHVCGHRSMPLAFNAKPTGGWNATRITCVDGVIQHEINGHLASSLYRASPRSGYISFESEGGPTEFRNMRVVALEADPEMNPKHNAPVLPEDMTCDYVTARKAVELPAGDFIACVDVVGKAKLSELVGGLNLPETEAAGRVVVTVNGGKVSATVGGKAVDDETAVPAGAKPVLHLENGKFGHVLVLKPAKK